MDFKQHIQFALICLLVPFVGTRGIVYLEDQRLYNEHNCGNVAIYHGAGVLLTQMVALLYLYLYRKTKLKPKVINVISILIAMVIANIGNIFMGFIENCTIRKVGLSLSMGLSPIFLFVSMTTLIPSIYHDKDSTFKGKRKIDLNNSFNMFSVHVGITVALSSSLQDVAISNIFFSLLCGFYILYWLCFSNDPEIQYQTNVAQPTNVSLCTKITLVCFMISGFLLVIIGWSVYYNVIASNALKLSTDSETIKNMVNMFVLYWVWSGPLVQIIIQFILNYLQIFIIDYIVLFTISISLIVALIGTELSFIIWGFMIASVSIPFFGLCVHKNIQIYGQDGELILVITLTIISFLGLANALKEDLYKFSEWRIILIIEGSITLFLTLLVFRTRFTLEPPETTQHIVDIDTQSKNIEKPEKSYYYQETMI